MPRLTSGEIAGQIGLKCLPVYSCLKALSQRRECLAKAAEAQAEGHAALQELYADQGKSKGRQALELVIPLAAAAAAWALGGPGEAATVLVGAQAAQAIVSEGADAFLYEGPIRREESRLDLEGASRSLPEVAAPLPAILERTR